MEYRPSVPEQFHPGDHRWGARPGLCIRKATLVDLPFVVRLSDSVFRVYGPYAWILAHSFLRAEVLTLLARLEKRRAGFAMLSHTPTPHPGPVELTALAVLPHEQRRGVGQLLLLETMEQARKQGFKHMVLHTAEGNIAARSLFQSEGFEIQGRLAAYYPEGQMALEMIRDLD